MRIYLDESKQIEKWKIIIWWFVTFHNTHYIEKYLIKKKTEFKIPENAELKSTKKYWKYFLENLGNDNSFIQLNIKVFWKLFKNYYVESEEWYLNFLIELITEIYNLIEIKVWEKIYIFHDNINANKNKVFEKKIISILNKNFWIKVDFKIHNSKKYLGLQLADLIVWDYRKLYLYNDITQLSSIFVNKKLKNKKT